MRRSPNPLALALLIAALTVPAARAAAVMYAIEVQSGGPGTVSPSGFVDVPAGGNQTFTFTPDGCNGVSDVQVDEVSVGGGVTQYTFTNVQSDHVLYVLFGPRPTTTTLDVRPVAGECAVPETLTATVANVEGARVWFYDGDHLLGTRLSGVPLVTAGLAVGSHTLSAHYLGTSCSPPSDSPELAYDVADADSTPVTLALTFSSNNVLSGTLVAVTPKLSIGGHLAEGVEGLEGYVTYYDGPALLTTAPFAGASPSFVMSMPVAHVLTAVAHLNLCVPPVTSPPETLYVYDPAATSLTLTISPPRASVGESVTLTAVVNRPNATGYVDFYNASATYFVNVPLGPGGVASYTFGPVSGSNFTMGALYEGNSTYHGCISNRVYLQIGMSPPPPLFSAPRPFNTGPDPSSVSIADLNADGRPDMATANVSSNTVSVVLGNGDGTFGPNTDYGIQTPQSVAIADLNADGRPDLAVASGGGASVLLGNGDGTFGTHTDFDTGSGSGPVSVAIADLDGDGRLDLAVANEFSQKVSMLRGNGDGTFAPRIDFDTAFHPHAVAIGDLNGDGHPDLVMADDAYSFEPGYTGGEVWVLLAFGDGTYYCKGPFRTGQSPHSLAIADVNGDGRLDLATANYGSNGSGSSVSVLMGNGDGTFGPQSYYGSNTSFGTGQGPSSVAIADFNADRRPDLAVGCASGVSVLLGNGNGTFAPRTDFPIGSDARGVAVADLNADGLPDVAAVGGTHGSVLLNVDLPIATLVAQFDATSGPDGIGLRWSFGDASRVASATVERAEDAAGPWEHITPELRRDGDAMVALDRTTDPGRTYFYRLEVKTVDGSTVTFGPISSTAGAVVHETALNLLAPNPARAASQIQYSVARAGHVRLEVADVGGRVVATLFDGSQQPGRFQLAWDGTNRGEPVPAGLYFVRLTTPDRTVARKLTRLQ